MRQVQILLAFVLVAAGCQQEPEYGGFPTNSGRGTEVSGNQSVTIELGATTTTSTVITYRVGGTASLDGDYYLTSLSSYYSDALTITVPAGESKATISFSIIDDHQVEPADEVIYFEVTSISDASIAENFRRVSYLYEIEDNDSAPQSDLQIDLSWNLGDGVRINRSNFDLFLADELTLADDGTVTSFHAMNGEESTNETGFETVTITSDLPDKQYYVIINYVTGEDPALLNLQLSSEQIQRAASGRVSAAAVGSLLYYGPITKSGTSFALR